MEAKELEVQKRMERALMLASRAMKKTRRLERMKIVSRDTEAIVEAILATKMYDELK